MFYSNKFAYFFIIITFFCFTNSFSEFSDKKIKELEKTLEFGIPAQRINALEQIEKEKDKNLYFLIKKTVENDENDKVLKQAIRLVGLFEIKDLEINIEEIIKKTEDFELKSAGIRTLGKLKYKKVADIAKNELDNDNVQLKLAAIYALGEIKDKKSLEKLYEILDKIDEAEAVLQNTLLAIGKIGDKKSIDKLKDVIENPGYSKYIRMYVPAALAEIGGKEVVEILKKGSKDKEFFIRIRSIHAITRLKNVDLSTLKKSILNALKDADMKVRSVALEVVEKTNDVSYIPIIKYIMDNDPEFRIRKKATKTYARVDSKGNVIKLFKEKLAKKSVTEKIFVISAMHNMPINDIIPILEETYYEKDSFNLRQKIIDFLKQKIKEDKAFDLLVRIIKKTEISGYKDSVLQLRGMALSTLTIRGWNKSFPILKDISSNEKDNLALSALKLIERLDKEKAKSFFLKIMNTGLAGKKQFYRLQVYKSVFNLKPVDIENDLKAAYFNEKDKFVRDYIGRMLNSYGTDPRPLEKEYEEMMKKAPK